MDGDEIREKARERLKKRIKRRSIIITILAFVIGCTGCFCLMYLIGSHSHGGTFLKAFKSGLKDLTGQYMELRMKEAIYEKEVPYLMQSDKRWKDYKFTGGTMEDKGAAPTCVSMVALFITKNRRYNPKKVAKYIMDNHYYKKNEGVLSKFLDDGCERFAIKPEKLEVDESAMEKALNDGKPIICSLKPGKFSDNKHFIVIRSYKGGKFYINDPASLRNTKKSWTFASISSEIEEQWSYEYLDFDGLHNELYEGEFSANTGQ